MLDEMTAAQVKLVDEVWSRRPADSIVKSKEELVTLASIVEKETAKADERPRVAAVFINRLKAGMRLQSDPTIIYGIAGGKGKLDRPISQADIEAETPFNTYRIDGLPPGPIATPGKDALEAVIAPAPTSDLYFVADGTGGHVFATTLEEHNANVKKWRAIEAGTAQPAATADPGKTPDSAAAAPAVPEVIVAPQVQLPNVAEEEAAASTVDTATADKKKAVSAPVAAGDVPLATPTKPAAATAAADLAAPPADPSAEKTTKLKPGTLVKVGKTLVPIPALKKAKP